MAIPGQKIPILLRSAEPTQVTVEGLQAQLAAIGLKCPQTSPEALQKSIYNVRKKMAQGAVQSWGISQIDAAGALSLQAESAPTVGNWTPKDDFGYQTKLEYIQYKEHFDWLKENDTSFLGTTNNPPKSEGKASTVEAIKTQFIAVTYTASSVLVNGLDRDTSEAAMANAIKPLTDADATDYEPGWASKVIFLVEDYNEETGYADGLGVLTISWNLVVKDYKEKKHATEHAWTLETTARAVLYSSLDDMNRDYARLEAHFGNKAFLGMNGIPPEKKKVVVFDSLPPAIHDTFLKGLPLAATGDYVDVIVLYAPDLQNIGSIDNSESDATATWSKAVTSGFTFSTTQTLSVGAKFEVNAQVAKAEVTVNLSVSFTEQWSKSQTETISFSVAPNATAFTYQGYMMSAVLRYSPKNNSYSYTDTARFLTSVLKTSKMLLGPDKN